MLILKINSAKNKKRGRSIENINRVRTHAETCIKVVAMLWKGQFIKKLFLLLKYNLFLGAKFFHD